MQTQSTADSEGQHKALAVWAATAHVADHARHAAAYAIKSLAAHEIPGAAANAAVKETQWQQPRVKK